MSFVNFSAQEPQSYGRHHRQPVPTARLKLLNEMQAEKENQRAVRPSKGSSRPKANSSAPPGPKPSNSQTPQAAHRLTSLAPVPVQYAPAQAPAYHRQDIPQDIPMIMSSDRTQVQSSGLRLPSTQEEDPLVYARPHLDHELEPRSAPSQDPDFDLDAAERLELEWDPHAAESEEGHEGFEDDENAQAVTADEGLRSLPPADNQITSTPVDLSRPPARRLIRRTAASTPPPHIAYHTPPPPAIPYATNPRQLVRRAHVLVPAAASSPDPRSSPTPASTKRQVSEVEGARDERDDPADDEDDEGQDGGALAVSRSRAADLAPVRRRIFDVAVRHMRLMSVSEAPHADAISLDRMAVASWFAALKDLQDTFGYEGSTQPTHEEIKLLKARLHQVKGDIKTVCREVIVGKHGYNILQDNSPESIAHNRQLVTDLLTGNAFLYRDPADRSIPGTLYEHPALQAAVNRVFFNDESNSEAILTPIYFANGLPLKTIACFSNALECVIMEYQTGTREKSRMLAKTWQPKFEKYLQVLQDWKVYTTNSGSELTQKLQIKLVQNARRHAKIDITPTAGTAVFTVNDFEKNDL
ncbi:hypothetical protein GGX14DRAFT_673203 [Mycena pura]|uniref:DUF6532 domain-containing protein n=1 Tax=Mycena pura TaxID=153505 RepID=A0AAD6V020_9AGAR|nr:hypothetical protein GGX14DRAFT_673203 [Mycena pura]